MKPRHTTPGQTSSKSRGAPSKRNKQSSPSTTQPLKPANPYALQPFEPDPADVYSLQAAAQIAGVPRRTILIYCKHHLVSCLDHPELWGYWFTADAIRTLRQITYLRSRCRDELESVATILQLLHEIRNLRAELRAQDF